jgi:NAD(P)-dependent dehydrogenase (short-subunit alcohol dehydrogenase family)
MRLRDKVAIVTGGSRGAGRAIALTFAKEGADVVIADRQPGNETAKAVQEFGRASFWQEVDVSKTEDAERMTSRTVKEFGKVDILVNNAAVFVHSKVVDMTEDQWNFVLGVNLKGAFLCCRAVAREMIRRNAGGKIVNISSNAGLVGYANYSAYCASKWGLLGFTQSLAKELAPFRINVNAICPGDIDTEMLQEEIRKIANARSVSEQEVRQEKLRSIPMGKFAAPQDIANLALFLVSDESSHITGDFIKVTGGK